MNLNFKNEKGKKSGSKNSTKSKDGRSPYLSNDVINTKSPRSVQDRIKKENKKEKGLDSVYKSQNMNSGKNMFNSYKMTDEKLSASNEDLSRNVFTSSYKSEIEEDIDYTNF